VGNEIERSPFARDAAARRLWNDRYFVLSHARAALFGAATSRAEAQVLRLSAIYAALDCSPIVTTQHLEAALAVWDYCSASAALIFVPTAIDPIVERIREALDASPGGLTRDQIRGLFQHHVRSERIDAALEQLTTLGTITSRKSHGRGRPSTLWSATEAPETEPE
jgi:DNA replicative helicase MCM subunit Mcm2 (Cdc46/Mcm family)